jgi:predicted ATP-dependent protease
MKKWDYSELSKEAKRHGGPEKFLAEYGDEKFNEGKLVGEDEGEKKGIIEGSTVTLLSLALIWGINKIYSFKARKNAEKIALSREKSSASAKEYIDRAECEDFCEEDYEDDE